MSATREQMLEKAISDACDLLAERTYGNPARSPGHNARLRLEQAIVASVYTDAPAQDANAREIAERFRMFGEKGFRPEVFGDDDRVPGPMVTRADCFTIANALGALTPAATDTAYSSAEFRKLQDIIDAQADMLLDLRNEVNQANALVEDMESRLMQAEDGGCAADVLGLYRAIRREVFARRSQSHSSTVLKTEEPQ